MSGTISYQIPVAGQPNSTEDAKVATALTTLLAAINGGLDSTNIAAVLAQAAGVNQAGQTVKGAVNIAASESRTNVAYGTLTTPDQVTGLVLPANGLIVMGYQATWQESVVGASNAAIFLNGNQVKYGTSGLSAPSIAQAGLSYDSTHPTANTPSLLATYGGGLLGGNITNTAYGGDVTTGQLLGGGTVVVGTLPTVVVGFGPCYIFAAAGTYTVSVQFKSSSGSVTASNRKLWVQAVSFA